MDRMFSKYKDEFISSINSALDLFYNSKDLADIKLEKNYPIDKEKYKEELKNISNLEKVLDKLKNSQELTEEDEKVALAAMGIVVVHLEFLAKSYKEAAEKAKIIIANVKIDA